MELAQATAGSYGIMPDQVEATFTARGGNVCAGHTYPLAMLTNSLITAADFTVFPGKVGSIWANVCASETGYDADHIGAIFVCAKESVLSGGQFRGVVRGICRAAIANRLATGSGGAGTLTMVVGRTLYPSPRNSSGNASGSAVIARHLDVSPSYASTQNLGRKSIAYLLQTTTELVSATGVTLNNAAHAISDGGYGWVYFDGTGIGAHTISLSN